MSNKQDIEKLIKEETQRRLEIMKDESYEFPKQAGKGTLIVSLIMGAICISLIAMCEFGVII